MSDYHPHNLPSVRECDSLSAQDFTEYRQQHYQPLVIRGFAAQWDLVSAGAAGGSVLADKFTQADTGAEQRLVTSPAAENGRLFYQDGCQKVNFSVSRATLTQGLGLMLARAENQDRHCFQSIPISDGLPAIASGLTNPLVPTSAKSFVWLGNDLRVAPHFDEADNIAVVVAGQRRFTLFPPEQVSNLYIGPLDYTPAGQPISLVDINAPDLERFPRYPEAYKQGCSAVLNPGDAIYIPSP